ncbi:MAG TPA: hypothetical protein PKE69_13895 [Pyrinomonadaceae bacterium]|nr:hypothetical protein [Pyrinomonadaceae bacterium]
MFEFEFEEPNRYECECCGQETTRLTRYVYKDGDAYAVYYALFKSGDEVVKLTVSLGEWGEEGTPEMRIAFALHTWIDDEETFSTRVIDAEESPWHDVEIIGTTLNRDDALKNLNIDEVFHIVDHIVYEDPELVEFFSSQLKKSN